LHGENSRKHHKRAIKITHSASLPNRLRKGRRGQRDGMSSLGQLADISGFRAQKREARRVRSCPLVPIAAVGRYSFTWSAWAMNECGAMRPSRLSWRRPTEAAYSKE
jgi:hypothetical protein